MSFLFFNFFFLFFKVRNEDYLHGSNKHLALHCAKICITSKRILRKKAGFNRKHSTTLLTSHKNHNQRQIAEEELNLLKLIGEYRIFHCYVINQFKNKICEVQLVMIS